MLCGPPSNTDTIGETLTPRMGTIRGKQSHPITDVVLDVELMMSHDETSADTIPCPGPVETEEDTLRMSAAELEELIGATPDSLIQ